MPTTIFIRRLPTTAQQRRQWFGLLCMTAAVGILCWNHARAQNDPAEPAAGARPAEANPPAANDPAL
ncbi:MAG: hypothetical protein WD030_02450, partial [Pirellulales bacterium]